MKIYLFPVVIGGFVITFILQAAMFANMGLQHSKLEKQIEEINKKLDKIQLSASSNIVPEISKIKGVSTADSSNTSTSNNSDSGSDLLSPANLAKTLGDTTSGPSVTLKATWNNVDVYETTKASSKIVGKIETGKTYPIVQKGNDWYQIKISPESSAWVQAQFVYETL